MITAYEEQELIDKIKKLSELELTGLMSELIQHLQKNKMTHLLMEADEVQELEDKISNLEEKIDAYRSLCSNIQDELNRI